MHDITRLERSMRTTMAFPRREAPRLARVRQQLPDDHIDDVRAEVRQRLLASGLASKIREGDSIAVTAGSRAMGGFIELLGGICDAVKQCGGSPFILPAMGSHGGATAEGQQKILELLGVSEASVGAPIHATMETVTLEASETGAVAHLDRLAAEADGIIVLGRTKTHPEYASGANAIASGLLKMVTVGLGKQQGAQQAHSHGLWKSVELVPKVTMKHAKILCGVATVENGYRKPVRIEVVEPTYEAFLKSDRDLLKVAEGYVAKLPFEELDLLIVDRIGKNISGTGMDLNVIGKWRLENDAKVSPNYRRIVALSLTPESLGNGLGIGMADFTTERFLRAYDPNVSYVNLLTAAEPDAMNTREGLVPIALPSDRDAIEVALYSAIAAEPRVCRIKDTDALSEFWISESLFEEAKQNHTLTILEPAQPINYDSHGNLF
jgi:hypothetical protein